MMISLPMDSRSDSDWNRQGQVTRAFIRVCSLGSLAVLEVPMGTLVRQDCRSLSIPYSRPKSCRTGD